MKQAKYKAGQEVLTERSEWAIIEEVIENAFGTGWNYIVSNLEGEEFEYSENKIELYD
tara:strand:+ start:637 stop:810 length:174 start_codon:yes stop_codon:yes gene_type:complete